MVGDREQGENEFQELLREIRLAAEVEVGPAAGVRVADESQRDAVMKDLTEARYGLNRAMSKLQAEWSDEQYEGWNTGKASGDPIYDWVEKVRDEVWSVQRSIDPTLKG